MDEEVKYHKFFDHFLSSVNSDDQLPVKIISSSTTKAEVKGTVLDWILQYLHTWNCPRSLISPLAKVILDEVRPSLDVNACPHYNEQLGVYTPIPLMQSVIGKIPQVFRRFVDGIEQYPQPVSDHPQYLSIFSTKNRRRCMEDCHVIISDLNLIFDVKNIQHVNYYAVFDGHNGSGAASYSSAHLHQFLVESQFYPMYPEQALSDAFKITDRHLLAKDDAQFKRSGTTAVCILWHRDEKMLYSAWVGDSEAVLAKKGKIYTLVEPHRAAREDERQRISDLNGVVLFWGSSWRVNGQLAISRAIGDSEHKPHVSSTPDIISLQLDGDEDFIILACDGLWDSVTYEDAARAVYNHILSCPDNYDQVSQILTKHAKTAGSEDNITVIVVFLRDPHTITLAADSMETATAESFTAKQNGSSFCSIGDVKNNFDHANDSDDFGPETNVDDDLISQSVSAKKSFTTFDKLNCNNPFGDLENHKNQDQPDLPKPKDTVPNHDKNNAVSDESDDEEWNYFKGGDKANSETSNLHKSSCSELDTSMRETEHPLPPLNPDAAEFVPLSPTGSKKSLDEDEATPAMPLDNVHSDVRKLLLQDETVASSPLKGQERSMEAIDVPPFNDFDTEIRKRPSNIMPQLDDSDCDSQEPDTKPALIDDVASLDNMSGISEANTSTKALDDDDSCYAAKLKDANDAIDADKDEDEDDDADVEEAAAKFESCSFAAHNGGLSVSDNDDDQFPSIVERSTLSSAQPLADDPFGVACGDREVPAFGEKRESGYDFPALDPNDSVVSHHMTGFGEPGLTNSMLFCGTQSFSAPLADRPCDDVELLSLDEKTDVSEKSQPSFNPFACQLPSEKETSEEKALSEAADETDLRHADLDLGSTVAAQIHEPAFGKHEVPDFMHEVGRDSNHVTDFTDDFCNFRPTKELNAFDESKESVSMLETAPSAPSNDVDELVCVRDTHPEVEANTAPSADEHPEPQSDEEVVEKHEAPEKPEEKHDSCKEVPQPESFEQIERRLSVQIVDAEDYHPRQFSAEECDRLEDVTVLSDCGEPDEPIRSVDAEAPYVHDCGRLDEKPGSVHHHTTHTKHYPDLLPDVTSTMESDKLESELRESEAKTEPEHVPVLEQPVPDDLPVSTQEVESEVPESQPSAVAAAVTASAVTAAAVATVAAATTAATETKKAASIIKKPDDKTKPSKPAPKPSLPLSKAKPAAPKTDLKKPAVSSTTNKLTSPRSTVPPRTAAPKPTAAPRTSAAPKPTLGTTKPAPAKPPVKLSSPAKPKLSAASSTTSKVMANGDVARAPAARKPLTSTAPLRKPSTEAKPAVTMSTRVSLAPKPRAAAATSTSKCEPLATASKVSSLTAARRPLSAPAAKSANKDTKDIANKRLSSATKSSPPTKSSSATNGKTESKVSSLSRGAAAPKSTAKSTSSPLRKPSAAAVSSANQTNSVDHQN